jgi:TolA-binding protein
MKQSLFLLAGLFAASFVPAFAQEPPAVDEIGRQAALLEAELGKYKDSTPEAAEVMVKLADLYYQDGRLFGLVRVTQQFVAAHPSDARHSAMMLKLIDAQQGLSRNKDLSATIRQFLSRYPAAPECPALEVRMADALQQLDDRLRTAEACRAVWVRQGPTEIGRRYGVIAIQYYSTIGSVESITQAAELGEQMLDKLPAGEFARQVGAQCFYEYRRIGQWAKSSAVGTKIIQKGVAGDPESQRQLHLWMAENHGNIGQQINAAQSLQQARALRDDQFAHYNLLYRLYHGAAKPNELEPLVNQYLQNYPPRPDRLHGTSFLANSCIANGEKPRGLALLKSILADDPVTHSNAHLFVRENGTEPPQLADTEQHLVQAIAQNKPGVHYLRYVLAFDLYRDRLKDIPKTKAVLRDLITKSPSNDGYTTGAIDWLLYNCADDNEFRNDLALILAARRQHAHLEALRDSVKNWSAAARQNKDFAARANLAAEQLKQANADPVMAAWIDQRNNQHPPGEPIRDRLLQPATFNAMSDDAARRLLQIQSEWFRHYSPGNKRGELVRVYAQYVARFPKDYQAALWWLQASTDYGKPEEMKAAAEHLLKFPPEQSNGDDWRRLLIAADRTPAASADLARATWAWMQQAQQKFGHEPSYASGLGDQLLKMGLEKEALEYWTIHLSFKRQHHESLECAARLLTRIKEPPQRMVFIQEQLKHDTDFYGRYAQWLADEYLRAGDVANFERVLRETRARQLERPLRPAGFEVFGIASWLDAIRVNTEMTPEVKNRCIIAIRDFQVQPASAAAHLALLEATPVDPAAKMARLLELQRATYALGNEWYDWDRASGFAVSAIARKDFVSAAVLTTGMLANIPNVDEARKKAVRDLATQALSRMGGVGLTIDDSSPLAPLLQAAMYYRLGDERMAFDAYLANKPLFDENRNQLPPDLLMFICERLMAAGSDAEHDYVEEVLRGWLVAYSESTSQEDTVKARMQLLLAKNFFKARRYDVARSEYTTVVNRYAKTPQAVDAEFGIGETFLAQKVFDQAEQVFEKLARRPEIDVVVRAEFLRGVLAFRRGDRDEARDILRSVLERVPNIELANQALFNLSEVYGAEERYIDQLNLLRTIGRLGRTSKRRHVPGTPLSVVVHDSDLGISRGHNRIPVRVTTHPGGDSEMIYLVGSGAGKGLFRAELETRLGQAAQGDHVLQLMGNDIIKCDYPDEFKAEFKNVPLSDVEISVAADAKFEIASSKIEDIKAESFSQQLERESDTRRDRRVSEARPANQIKPGNPIYIRVKDADRDLSGDVDQVVVKLTADSGDQIQIVLQETGSHTGIFEGIAKTGDLPAGALASDTAIDHSALMAIDRDPKTFWMSEPDGATPKWLTVDMKDLRSVGRVKIATPDTAKHAPIRGDLMGSQDGQFWFRIASHPEREPAPTLASEYGQMMRRVYAGNHTDFTTWEQVVALNKNGKPFDEAPAENLLWQRPDEGEDAAKPFTVVWQGKFVQAKSGAVRIAVKGGKTAILMDGILELPVGPGGRSVDLWLASGTHDLAIFAASAAGNQPVEAQLARANLTSEDVTMLPFRAVDFDLTNFGTETPPDGPVLAPQVATIPLLLKEGKFTKKTEQFGVQPYNGMEVIGAWQSPDDLVQWDFEAATAGPHEIWLDLSHEGEGGRFLVFVGDKLVEVKVPNTGGWANFRRVRVATVLIDQPGRKSLSIRPVEIGGAGLMVLKEISLRPATGPSVVFDTASWEFRFPKHDLRYVRFVCNEYSGEALAISNIEVGGQQPDELYIPTKEDVLSLAANDTLEIAGGDNVTATYTDEVTLNDLAGSQLLVSKLQATYFNAAIRAISYDFDKASNGAVFTVRKELKRIDPGERIVVEIVDYDEDRTDQRDTVPFEVVLNDGQAIQFMATETEANTGIFTKEVDTSAMQESGKIRVKAGDQILLRYFDTHNTFPGHSVPREEVVYVAKPTSAIVRVLETRVVPPPKDSKQPPQILVLPKKEQDPPVASVAFEAPFTVEVIDPDSAKDSRSTALVTLTTTDGATVDVECQISAKYSDLAGASAERLALEEGRFVGQVILQLGGKNSPAIVPVITEMPRDLIGKVRLGDKLSSDNANANLVTRVLNLAGKDIVTATYKDIRHPQGKPVTTSARGRLVSNGQLMVTDRDYEKDVTVLHVGERLFLKVIDADLDTTDARDFATVEITTELGEKETIRLEETLAHSGQFTGSLQLKAVEKPTPGNLDPADPVIESYFGDQVTVRFVDLAASTETGTLEQIIELPVVVGTDGLVTAFSKTFHDEGLAVETKFRIAESYFELFKSHKTLGREAEKKIDLEAGRRVLREVMEDFPDPKYAPRIVYLLGQFAQELDQWDEAIKSYDLILRQYPDHNLAPDAQYKLAQCYELAGDFDQALEAYVTLAATHPKSPLIPNVMIRISDYFYKHEKYEIAAQVGEKFLERFESHSNAPRMAFRIGQCYYKAKKYQTAGKAFDKFTEVFLKDALCADAFFWAGESYRMVGNNRQAFISYNNCRWKHPDSEGAKYARGRLALPEMLQQFEAEANSVDDNN